MAVDAHEPRSLRADAVFDDVAGVVHIAGQMLGDATDVGDAVCARPAWGPSATARCGALGSFGLRIPAGPTAVGTIVTISVAHETVEITVR